MRTDKGQAMVEFVVGVFALVLIISALIIFGRAIPEATRHLSLVRVKAGRDAQSAAGGDTLGSAPPAVMDVFAGADAPSEPGPIREETLNFEVNVSDVGAESLFGFSKLHLSETAVFPVMTIPKPMRAEGGALP